MTIGQTLNPFFRVLKKLNHPGSNNVGLVQKWGVIRKVLWVVKSFGLVVFKHKRSTHENTKNENLDKSLSLIPHSCAYSNQI